VNKKNILAASLLICLFIINKSTLAETDWEYWNHYEIAGSINDKLDFKVKPAFRHKDDFNNHYYTHFDIGLDWKVNDWFVLSQYYCHVNEKKKGNWKVEYRPHLNITFKWKFLGLSFSERNKLEYRIKEDKEFFRYRNKLTVKLPKFTQSMFQVYISEELFYDFDANELNKNRVYTDMDFKVINNLKAGLYYILESRKKKDEWINVNVLGTVLRYSF